MDLVQSELTVGLEELLILIEHAVQPWQKLLGAVVGVENDWDAVCGRNGADVVGTGDGSLDGSALVLVVDALSGKVCGTTLAHLQDDGGLRVAGGLERSDNGRGGGDVDGGDGVALGLGVLEEVVDILTVDDTGPREGNVSLSSRSCERGRCNLLAVENLGSHVGCCIGYVLGMCLGV